MDQEISILTRTVLLVEDEPRVGVIAADLLRAMGYDVIEVGAAHAALKHVHSHCARFDFAVIDMGLLDLNKPYKGASLRTAIGSLGLAEPPREQFG